MTPMEQPPKRVVRYEIHRAWMDDRPHVFQAGSAGAYTAPRCVLEVHESDTNLIRHIVTTAGAGYELARKQQPSTGARAVTVGGNTNITVAVDAIKDATLDWGNHASASER
jgi:hypothetical protein